VKAPAKDDVEWLDVRRIMRILALHDPEARDRMMAYIVGRKNTLPVIAAVGGGTEDDDEVLPALPFHRSREGVAAS